MAWSKRQITLAHMVKNAVGWNEPNYRMILQNVAGIKRFAGKISSTNPTADNAGFERFMAFAESQGFVDVKNGQGYWRQEVQKQNARIHYKIEDLAQRAVAAGLIGPDALAGFVERQTHSRPFEEGGSTRSFRECDAVWSYKILEGLKGWVFREARLKNVTLAV